MIRMIIVLSFSLIFQEIDHGGYVRQAFEAASLTYLVEFLQSDVLKESDVSYSQFISVCV